jgi:hypothetical protein
MNFGRTYDAHVYALLVAAGVPLMAALVHGTQAKLLIACIWFAVVPVLYLWLEGMEINAQIAKYGLLRQQDSDYQREAMYYPYYGVAFAFVMWLLVDAIVTTIALSESWHSHTFVSMVGVILGSPLVTPLRYGIIEWLILVHTLMVGKFAILVYYPLMTNFLQATAGQKRFEERVP